MILKENIQNKGSVTSLPLDRLRMRLMALHARAAVRAGSSGRDGMMEDKLYTDM